MAKNNDWKSRLGMVYSTNPDFQYDDVPAEEETLPPNKQKLRVRIEKSGRAGKTVTVVAGFVGSDADIKALAKKLKTKCGTGGSVKDGEIIIQGEVKQKVIGFLVSEGFSDTK